MGEEQSKPEGQQHDHSHNTGASDLSPAQRYWGQAYKCTKKEDFALMNLEGDPGKEPYKYMDVRGSTQPFPGDDGLLHFEMFWAGELPSDQEKFKGRVSAELDKFGAKWESGGSLREAGCMISMVAYPFSISEEKAMELGHAMFSDFINPPESPPRE